MRNMEDIPGFKTSKSKINFAAVIHIPMSLEDFFK
jgi:hypothetical protein